MLSYMNTIEEISLNAWPAHKIELYDGWLIRFSHNYTHRTNCVNLVAPSTLPLEEKVAFCEKEYINAHTPCIFKISPLLDPAIDAYLEQRNYIKEHITDVLTMDFTNFVPYKPLSAEYESYRRNSGLPSFVTYPNNVIVQLCDTITDDWVHNLFRLNGTTNPTHYRIVPAMFKAIPKETIVACIEIDGRMVASGLGILDRDHVGLYAIYVDASCRKKQFGKAICSTILNEARKMGIQKAYLQVVEGNQTAHHLYESFGFEYFYTYWFRSKQVDYSFLL